MSRGAYRAIHTVLLDGPDYQALTPEAKLVLITLKLNLGPTGIDVLYPAVLEPQTGLSARAIVRALEDLERANWIRRERNVVWIVTGLRHEPSRSLTNANHRKEIGEHLDALPRLPIVEAFRAHYELPASAPATHANGMGDGIPNGMGDGIPKHGEREKGKKGETEKGNGVVADATDADDPIAAEFALLWARYPKRAGSNPRTAAERAYRARRREGARYEAVSAGLDRYGAWCAATGKIGTEMVKQGATFFGRDRCWEEAYDLPATPAPVTIGGDAPGIAGLTPARLRDTLTRGDLLRVGTGREDFFGRADAVTPEGMDRATWHALLKHLESWKLGAVRSYDLDQHLKQRLATFEPPRLALSVA